MDFAKFFQADEFFLIDTKFVDIDIDFILQWTQIDFCCAVFDICCFAFVLSNGKV